MIKLRRFVAILELLKSMPYSVGKTFLQKGIYILQEGLREDLEYKYRLYLYGPFSQELANDIDLLGSLGLIDVKYESDNKRYRITITERGKEFLEKFKAYEDRDLREKIRKVLSLLIGERAEDMELLGTVLYFAKLTDDEVEIKRLVKTTKPHFSNEEIEKALNLLRSNGII